MADDDIFEKHGLFSSRVPRYTSYPPANRFQEGTGQRVQPDWLAEIDPAAPISLYIHIPFCKRLCWFCACRTQGTKSIRPVENYVSVLLQELAQVRGRLRKGVRISRLHLGGGTPTILPPEIMERLLQAVFEAFDTTDDFEFSVEADPTDAPEPVLDVLLRYGLHRASIGVQDFDPKVQNAIGRRQSVEQTRRVVDYLREHRNCGINIDLLYGLPFQTLPSLTRTLDHVVDLAPDRLALYGYAHVPWMSKRQVVIDDDVLPNPHARLDMTSFAANRLQAAQYRSLGVDHFALPHDGLYRAARSHKMSRNFQGYTDDQAPVLLGLGASAISKFPQGFIQNAVSTSAYLKRVSESGLAGFKGYALSEPDRAIAEMVEQMMCYASIRTDQVCAAFPSQVALIAEISASLLDRFSDVLQMQGPRISLLQPYQALVRIVASAIDATAPSQSKHSFAI